MIRNPEIASLLEAILEAIAEPSEKTHACLDLLLDTTFVNAVDAPSLALVVPVITRGLRSKTDLKKKASKVRLHHPEVGVVAVPEARTSIYPQIVGNLCALVATPADLVPYVPLLLPELKRALVDPSPEVRTIAARALASLLSGMGVAAFPELVPWLLSTLQCDGSSVERSGAAQGLAEVLAVLGDDHFSTLLPSVVEGCRSSRATAREGFLLLLRHLPFTMGTTFETHLPVVLPLILDNLSDEAEGAREAALSAGRVFVERYARTAMPLLLPAVEAGIGADSWRIRQSSCELLGALLFRVAGVTGKIQTDSSTADGDGVSTEATAKLLASALGACCFHIRRISL